MLFGAIAPILLGLFLRQPVNAANLIEIADLYIYENRAAALAPAIKPEDLRGYKKIYICGCVRRPGVYLIKQNVDALDVIEAAGIITYNEGFASAIDRVTIIKSNDAGEISEAVIVNYARIRREGRLKFPVRNLAGGEIIHIPSVMGEESALRGMTSDTPNKSGNQ